MTEDNFTIRKASPADLPRIHGIYAAARQFMRDHGNFSQWDGEDAPEHLLPGDIEAGNLYVLEENGVIPVRCRPPRRKRRYGPQHPGPDHGLRQVEDIPHPDRHPRKQQGHAESA